MKAYNKMQPGEKGYTGSGDGETYVSEVVGANGLKLVRSNFQTMGKNTNRKPKGIGRGVQLTEDSQSVRSWAAWGTLAFGRDPPVGLGLGPAERVPLVLGQDLLSNPVSDGQY